MPTDKGIGFWIFLVAVFVVASALGGLLKLPSPVGSIAFDSAPGYFLAAFVGPGLGGVVGALGHLASAASAGFPLGHIHIWVAGQMFVWCAVFGLIARIGDRQTWLVPAVVVAVALNGYAGPTMLAKLGVIDAKLAGAVIWILSVASFANVVVACLAIYVLARATSRRVSK